MRKWIVVFLFVAAIVGASRRAEAAPVACFTDFGQCELSAASESSFWWRTLRALDCEINLWGCLKEALI